MVNLTDIETKTISHKAAKKAGLKLNEWIDRALREKGTEELTKKAEPPAKTEDLLKILSLNSLKSLKRPRKPPGRLRLQ